jgi:hypothetical protein
MRVKNVKKIEINDFLLFTVYLYQKLGENKSLSKYHIDFDIDRYSLEKTVELNKDQLAMDVGHEYIELLWELQDTEKYKASKEIEDICKYYYKKD